MRTTVTISDELLAKAAQLTGKDETAVLVRMGIEALIERESAHRLALLGGSDPQAVGTPRRRADSL